VRFHSLPASTRNAEKEVEYAEVLHRHNAIVGELARGQADPPKFALIVTASWSGASSTPLAREDELERLLPGAMYWKSLLLDTDVADSESWIHLYVNEAPLKPTALAGILRLVADGRAAETIIMPLDLSWLYHPCDGGADVIATSPAQRDALCERHRAWLPVHPLGL
jgi:hypothetical protein